MPTMDLRSAIRRALNLPGWEAIGRRALSSPQWRHLPKTLTIRERIIFSFGAILILAGIGIIAGRFYLDRTQIAPAAGGRLTVGIVGRPLYLNPVLAPSNPVDEALIRLTSAGLFRYDAEGRLIPDLAESFAIGDFGKTIDVTLRRDLQWPDGALFTVDDVIFTTNAVKDPAIRSPLFSTWIGINIEAIDAYTVRFTLPAPYPPFLHNLTLGILPKHLWEDVAPENFALSDQNLKPLGLGAFRPARFERTRDGKILSYSFERNLSSPRPPLLERITFRFFDQHAEAVSAFNRGEVQLISAIGPEDSATLRSGAKLRSSRLPRIFALFFNQSTSRILADKTVRQALSYATDRRPLLEVLGGDLFVTPLERPIPADMLGATEETDRYDFAPNHARNILEATGLIAGEDGIRAKGGERLTVTVTIPENADLNAVATILQTQWREIGIAGEIRTLGPDAYRRAIAERSYQALLAGQELPVDPDPYAFWHSSQKFDPGGNVALYENPRADQALQISRTEFNDDVRADSYIEFQRILMADVPAIFLWQANSVSATDPTLRGVDADFLQDPSWRFGSIHDWYVHTKRVWKSL